jgi:predicted transcriptional regulator
MTIEEDVLRMIMSKEEGILQCDIWKSLGIDSRKCSRIVTNLENKGLTRRNWEKIGGTRTYRIVYARKYDYLMAGGMLAPCIGCSEECAPEYCALMDEWLKALVKET